MISVMSIVGVWWKVVCDIMKLHSNYWNVTVTWWQQPCHLQPSPYVHVPYHWMQPPLWQLDYKPHYDVISVIYMSGLSINNEVNPSSLVLVWLSTQRIKHVHVKQDEIFYMKYMTHLQRITPWSYTLSREYSWLLFISHNIPNCMKEVTRLSYV